MADENTDTGTPAADTTAPIEEVTQFQAPDNQTPTQERPEGLPEGFDSWEAFGKAQLAKESEEGKDGADADADTTVSEPLDAESQKEVDARLADLPEDRREAARPLFEEFARSGDLSDEQRDEAAKTFGVTREMVDIYVKGFQSNTEAELAPLYEAAGGKTTVDEFTAWAKANYTPEQMEAYDKGLTTDPTKTVTEAIALWRSEGNAPVTDVTRNGASGGNQGAAYEGYASEAEQTAAMSDPRYRTDEAYRKGVEAKVGKTDFNLSRSR